MTLKQVEDRLISPDLFNLFYELPEGSEAKEHVRLSIHYARLVAAKLHEVMQLEKTTTR